MNEQRITGLLLDFGRVLGNFDHLIACRALAEFAGGRHSAEEIRQLLTEQLAKEHEAGAISSLEFHRGACDLLQITVPFEEFKTIWSSIFSPNPGIETLLARIPSHIAVGVCSNTDPLHWEEIAKLPVTRTFFHDEKRLARSFDPDIRARKPSETIFRKALERLGDLPPEQVLYVDDIPEYAQAFEALGGTGVVYDSSRMPVSELEAQLDRYKLLN